jgi:hypothetical protein
MRAFEGEAMAARSFWIRLMYRFSTLGGTLIVASLGFVAAGAHGTEDRPEWITTSDGAFFVHLSAGVAWPRCFEGMRWTGQRCDGHPLQLSHADALALARSRSQADGVAWRLPTVKELQRFGQHNLRQSRGKSSVATEWCWSGTSVIDTSQPNEYSYGNVMRGVNSQNMVRVNFLHAWSVNTSTAETRSDTPKSELLYVRLIRSID